jgi:hypothetical protein
MQDHTSATVKVEHMHRGHIRSIAIQICVFHFVIHAQHMPVGMTAPKQQFALQPSRTVNTGLIPTITLIIQLAAAMNSVVQEVCEHASFAEHAINTCGMSVKKRKNPRQNTIL